MAYRDPFQNTPDVSAYVARPATEEALDSLLTAVRSGEQLVALVGPAGIGKTLLLHVLADRARDETQLVRVPVPSLPPEGLFGWLLATLGVSTGEDPRGRLLDETRKADAAGCPLLVAIDDASALPEESAEALRKLHAETAPALRVVLAFGTDEASERRLSQFGASITTVRLDQPMSSAETALYVHSRLLQGDVDGTEAVRFDPEAISQLHDHSGGLPGQVNELAEVLLRPEETARAHEHAGELRPESLAFALLSDAETEHRMSDWSDEELARVVASRGSNEHPEIAPTEPQPALELAIPYTPPAPQQGTAPVATASALLSREARNVPMPELPELPEPKSFGLGARILDALAQESAPPTAPVPQQPVRSDEFVELASPATVTSVERVRDVLRAEPEEQLEVSISTSPSPSPSPSPTPPPRANPVAERILESLRNPAPRAASQRTQETGALPPEAPGAFADPASRILAALEVEEPSHLPVSVTESDLAAATAEAEELARELAEEPSLEPAFAGDSVFTSGGPPAPEPSTESFDESSALLPYVPAPSIETPESVSPPPFPKPFPQSYPADSVLLPDPPSPTASSEAHAAASGSLPPLTLSDLSSGSRSLRSLGVFDGGSDRIEVSRPVGLEASESMEELAGEITRAADHKRGLRTETFALALGIVLFAGGGLVYWASTPKQIVRPPTIQAPASPYVAEAATVDAPAIASGLPVDALAQPAPAQSATAPSVAAAAPVAPAVQQEMTFWPPLETAEVETATQAAATTAAPAESIPSSAATALEAPASEVVAPEPVVAATPPPSTVDQETPGAAEVELAAVVPIEIPEPIQTAEPTEAAELAIAEPTEAAELAIAEPIEALEVAEVLEIAESTAVTSTGALAGLRPPAAIAAPSVAERVLPVTVRGVPGYTIEIDGIERGASPLFGLLLSEGTHRVVAIAADGTRDEQLFEVDDQNLEVTFDSPASR